MSQAIPGNSDNLAPIAVSTVIGHLVLGDIYKEWDCLLQRESIIHFSTQVSQTYRLTLFSLTNKRLKCLSRYHSTAYKSLLSSRYYSATMTTGSGDSGFCTNTHCEHANHEHKRRQCKSPGCKKMWKRCQVAGKCNGVHYRICAKCRDHPGAEPDW